jgi:hypothetical protein
MERRKQAWLIIGGSVALLIVILILKQVLSPPPICDPNIKSKTVILLDHSETVAVQTVDTIVERAWKHIEENVPAGELVSIYEVTKISKTNLRPLFEACKPRSEGSQYIENIKKITRDFANFKKKLKEDLSTPIKATNEPAESPIAQALIDLSLDDKHFRSSDATKLLVFSDLLEYTPKFSLYSCTSGKQAIQSFRNSRIGAVERPTFKHTEVQLHVIPRSISNKTSLQCRDEFWLWFFGDNQGSCKKETCLSRDDLPG